MELYLIRHGQSVNNALGEDIVLRVQDPPLTELGHQQVQTTAAYLATSPNLEALVTLPPDDSARQNTPPYRFTHLYASAMHRAIQTGYPIAARLGLRLELWTEIHEHGGVYLEKDGVVTGFGGRTRSQIAEEFPECVVPEDITEEGWWNPAHGQEEITLCDVRALRVADKLRARAMHPDTAQDIVALISHGTFMDSLIKALCGTLGQNGSRPAYHHWHYNTAITRLDFWHDGRVIIRYVNRVTHLPTPLLST